MSDQPVEPESEAEVDSARCGFMQSALLVAGASQLPAAPAVVCPFVGGGFGCKGTTWSQVMLAAMASRAAGVPVKLVLERSQMYGPVGARPLTEQRLATLNVGVPTYMRVPGESSGSFALESAMDELAYALNVDPVQLRLLNYAEKDPEKDIPWSSKSLREC